MIKTLVLAS